MQSGTPPFQSDDRSDAGSASMRAIASLLGRSAAREWLAQDCCERDQVSEQPSSHDPLPIRIEPAPDRSPGG
jgi:hypothetical protein